MGDMSLNKLGSVPGQRALTGDLPQSTQSAKIQSSPTIQASGEGEPTLQKLGAFLERSLGGLRQITFGDAVAPVWVPASGDAVVSFAHSDSAKAAADADQYLQIHEQSTRLN